MNDIDLFYEAGNFKNKQAKSNDNETALIFAMSSLQSNICMHMCTNMYVSMYTRAYLGKYT